jgi:hypothetical protein
MSEMTLEQVRDEMNEELKMHCRIDNTDVVAWRNAIDAHLAQASEVSQEGRRAAYVAGKMEPILSALSQPRPTVPEGYKLVKLTYEEKQWIESPVINLDFSKPLETENGEPVTWVCADVIQFRQARVCVDQQKGIVYSSPYTGLKIRNAAPAAPESGGGDEQAWDVVGRPALKPCTTSEIIEDHLKRCSRPVALKWKATTEASTVEREADIVSEIVTELCDLAPFDPDHADSVCVDVNMLISVLEDALSQPRPTVPDKYEPCRCANSGECDGSCAPYNGGGGLGYVAAPESGGG